MRTKQKKTNPPTEKMGGGFMNHKKMKTVPFMISLCM